MQKVNLRSVNLNLLVILQQLLEWRNVTRAAEALHMSQPAVSRALQQLRRTFDDPLLVKAPQGFDLTPRAQELAPQLHTLLANIDRLIAAPEFDPAKADDTVYFYGVDPEIVSFLPPLFNYLREQAPNMTLSVRSDPRDHFELLETGKVHFALTAMEPSRHTDQFRRKLLLSPKMTFVMHAQHPLASKTMTLKRYLAASHGFVTVTGKGTSPIDQKLAALNLSRKVSLVLSSFTLIPHFCENSDVIFVVPEVIAQALTKGRPLISKPIPDNFEIDLSIPDFYLYWHERHQDDPMCHWVRENLQQLVAQQAPNQ